MVLSGQDALRPDRSGAATFLSAAAPGVEIISLGQETGERHMLEDVRHGLDRQPRTIPPTYFYDGHGSELYERITQLEEYYPTRTEAALLKRIAPELRALVAESDPSRDENPLQIVELGSGSSAKTRILFDAWNAATETLAYIPVDVSETMLTQTAHRLNREYPALQILGLAGQYDDALALLPPEAHRLVLFLGGTIGNFTVEFQEDFFTRLRALMTPGTKFLLGFDRRPHAGKDAAVIHDAYNDRAGVTAQFNLNVLTHINRVLSANFNLSQWRHRALYNADAHQIEMYLQSLTHQVVTIGALDTVYEFAEGEEILTEISRKFDPDELAHWFSRHGFRPLRQWTDEKEFFALTLFEMV